jgi:hypothetical protein
MMTVKRTSSSIVMTSLTLMPVLSIWLVCLKKLRIEKIRYWVKLHCQSVRKIIYSSCYTHFCLLKYHYGREKERERENQKSLDVDKRDYCWSGKRRFENPTLFKSFPMRFDQDCMIDKLTPTKPSSKMRVGL